MNDLIRDQLNGHASDVGEQLIEMVVEVIVVLLIVAGAGRGEPGDGLGGLDFYRLVREGQVGEAVGGEKGKGKCAEQDGGADGEI